MRISRLYVAMPLSLHQRVELDEDSAHYLRAVLRLKKGQAISLFNGEGGEFLGQIIEVSRKKVLIKLQSFTERSVESNLLVVLGLGVSRGDRMNFSIQKSVELGVTQLTPLMTECCVVQLTIKLEPRVLRTETVALATR